MSKNKQLIYILVLFISIVLTFGENSKGSVEFDGSFLTFCAARGGTYIKRSFDHSENGDLCKITYPIATEGEEAAKRFCKVALPYRLHEVKDGKKTTCVAESLIICPSNYQQIDGQCFQLADEHEHYTYDEAVKICEKKNATIARLKKSKTSAYWKYYYPELSMVWVDVTDDIASYSVYDDGGNNYAVLHSSAILFRKRRNSLVKIDGKTNRGLVMCEKPHKKTGAYVIYKMKKYSEIYYDTVLHREMGYFRSANRYWKAYYQDLNGDICKKIAKPFSYIDEEAYRPYDLSIVEKFFGENLIVSRSFLTLERSPKVRDKHSCQRFSYQMHKVFTLLEYNLTYPSVVFNYYHDPCDNQWSFAFFKFKETMTAKITSDAMRAPFLCQTHLSFTRHDKCQDEKDFTFQRANGDIVCHQYFSNKLSWDAAQDYCQKEYGGFLSGFTSADEFNTLKRISAKDTPWQVWIGGRRIKECLWNGWSRNGRGWDDNLCTKAKNEPNMDGGSQDCLAISHVYKTRLINDHQCGTLQSFICQRPAVFTYSAQRTFD